MTTDSFKFLPRMIAALYTSTDREPELPIPWTPLAKPLAECRFSLLTTGGLYVRGEQRPFNLDRERTEPTWGDPAFRAIPTPAQAGATPPNTVAAEHLHINTSFVEEDVNVLLPLTRFQELAASGTIGSLAPTAYSLMGFQGFPPDMTGWLQTAVPAITAQLKQEEVDCLLLTPA